MTKKLWTVLLIIAVSTLFFYQNCERGYNDTPNSSGDVVTLSTGTTEIITGNNVLPVCVGSCGTPNFEAPNIPYVSVTICVPGTNNCQTIDHILVSTRLVGLRIFASELNLPLAPITDSSGNAIGECYQSAAGDVAVWGPMVSASVTLASEPAVTIPIQLMQGDFGPPPKGCEVTSNTPDGFAAKGVLGVGPLAQDCGSDCLTVNSKNMYYDCPSTGCVNTTAMPLAQQIGNPVAALPIDNNGVSLTFSTLSDGATTTATGYLVLGLGTSTNNASKPTNVFATNSSGAIMSTVAGTSGTAWIDSMNQINAFYDKSLALCSNDPELYCPSSETQISATIMGTSGSPSVALTFPVGNGQTMMDSPQVTTDDFASPDFAGAQNSPIFWGLPFFFGRTVYVGIAGKTVFTNTGPLYGY